MYNVYGQVVGVVAISPTVRALGTRLRHPDRRRRAHRNDVISGERSLDAEDRRRLPRHNARRRGQHGRTVLRLPRRRCARAASPRGSAAEKAGIKVGDIITELDGAPWAAAMS